MAANGHRDKPMVERVSQEKNNLRVSVWSHYGDNGKHEKYDQNFQNFNLISVFGLHFHVKIRFKKLYNSEKYFGEIWCPEFVIYKLDLDTLILSN
jgi:hypothetical protein